MRFLLHIQIRHEISCGQSCKTGLRQGGVQQTQQTHMVLKLRSRDAVEVSVSESSCASTSDLLSDGMLASKAAASDRLSTPVGSSNITSM